MHLPKLDDLASEEFLRNHCFFYAGREQMEYGGTVRIDFRAAERIRAPDVHGSIWLDSATWNIIGAAGAAVGSAVGGRTGAIVGGGVGGAAGAAIGSSVSQPKPKTVVQEGSRIRPRGQVLAARTLQGQVAPSTTIRVTPASHPGYRLSGVSECDR